MDNMAWWGWLFVASGCLAGIGFVVRSIGWIAGYPPSPQTSWGWLAMDSLSDAIKAAIIVWLLIRLADAGVKL